jgi:GT2 family glycosyltransferase
VGIATRGRAEILCETLKELRKQTRPADRIVICHADPEDVDGILLVPGLELRKAPPGLPVQRNIILNAVTDCDFLLFLDDDFLPAPGYIAATLDALQADPAIVVTTGAVIADGIKGPGFTPDHGRRLLAEDAPEGTSHGLSPAWNGYGCNMAIRLATARQFGIRFDERLPLYAWYEDIDYTRRLGQHGRIVRVGAARGVHLGAKSGRTSGKRLGYSQVMNPVYLARKGTYPWKGAMRSIAKHLTTNLFRSVCPEAWVDRRGRLFGNGLAVIDLCRGRIMPERILCL